LPEIAARMIRQLQAMGFKIQLVLGDSLYGESKTNFVNVLDELKLPYILAIRSNHGMWLPEDQQVYGKLSRNTINVLVNKLNVRSLSD
jgi:SRSO17 transposase